MDVSVLGGGGAWPSSGTPCGGYLVEHEGFRLLIDPGYGSMTQLPRAIGPTRIDAVYVSHGHPDHYADLHPLLRGRVLEGRTARLPVFAPPGAVDGVLRMDGRGELDGSYDLVELTPGGGFEVGPFMVHTRLLPHFVPNAGLRLEVADFVFAFTGDSGPDPAIAELARDANVFIAEATFPLVVPERFSGFLSSARLSGETATQAGVGQLILAHQWPGSNAKDSIDAARQAFAGTVRVATPGLTLSA